MNQPAQHLLNPADEESYYDILKVSRNATISEIVAAYHTAKNAFSRESVATYSLFSGDETKAILEKLETAYSTLSNIEKKREYDQFLQIRDDNGDVPAMTELELKKRAGLQNERPSQEKKPGEVEFTPLTSDYDGHITGTLLKEIRENRKITISEISRITKIPSRYIESIEKETQKDLPARVYLQGFIKNLCSIYKIDPTLVTKSYLDYMDHKNDTDPE